MAPRRRCRPARGLDCVCITARGGQEALASLLGRGRRPRPAARLRTRRPARLTQARLTQARLTQARLTQARLTQARLTLVRRVGFIGRPLGGVGVWLQAHRPRLERGPRACLSGKREGLDAGPGPAAYGHPDGVGDGGGAAEGDGDGGGEVVEWGHMGHAAGAGWGPGGQGAPPSRDPASSHSAAAAAAEAAAAGEDGAGEGPCEGEIMVCGLQVRIKNPLSHDGIERILSRGYYRGYSIQDTPAVGGVQMRFQRGGRM